MVQNKKYGRTANEGKSIEYAPVLLPPKLTPPTEEEYNAAGWYKIEIQPADPPEGKIVSSVTYVIDGNIIVADYEYEDAPPPPPRRFNKYKIVDALMKRGIWVPIKQWLMSEEEMYDRYVAAEDISEDEEMLAIGIELVKENFGLTDEEIAEILAEAEF